ncbi:MAG: phosphatase PAP2 family protein [Microthrixaceae bacterium]
MKDDPDPLTEVVDETEPFADASQDSPALRRARRRAGWMSIGLLLVAAVLAVSVAIDPVTPWFQFIDDWWLRLMQTHQNRLLTDFAKVLNVVGSGVVTWPLRVGALLLLLLRRRFTQGSAFVIAVVLSELCIGPLKFILGRQRPLEGLVSTTSASFPSGHAIATAVTAFGLVIAFMPRGRRRLHWMIAASFLGGAMAWSRTYLGAHWATDTIAGIGIGVGLAVGVDVVLTSLRTEVAEVDEFSDKRSDDVTQRVENRTSRTPPMPNEDSR